MRFETTDGPIPPTYHRFLGSKTGIIRELSVVPPDRGGPQAYTSAATVTDLGTMLDADDVDIDVDTGGKGIGPDDVLVGAIGETCERYARLWPDEDAIETASYEEISEQGPVVPFEHLSIQDRGDDADLPPLSRQVPIDWVAGRNALTGEPVYVPAAFAWDGIERFTGTQRRFIASSSGCAAGARLEAALLGGLLELIERDGVMRTWLTRETPPSLAPGELLPPDQSPEALLPNQSLSLHAFEFDSMTDIPTVGVSIVDERDRRPKFVIGGAAGFDPEAIVLDAFTEAVQGRRYLSHLFAFDDPEPVGPEDTIANFTDNALLYAEPDEFDRVSFLLEGERTTIDPAVPGDGTTDAMLQRVLDALDDADCTPIVVDITPRDIDAVGVHVVTVVVPELLPLTPPGFPPVEHPAVEDMETTTLPHPYP